MVHLVNIRDMAVYHKWALLLLLPKLKMPPIFNRAGQRFVLLCGCKCLPPRVFLIDVRFRLLEELRIRTSLLQRGGRKETYADEL